MLAPGSARFGGEKATLPFCGNDAVAKAKVGSLINDAGFEPQDVGPLIKARTLEPLATGLFPGVGLKMLRQSS